MKFSACWYPTQNLSNWKLDGAEIMLEKHLIPVYEKMVEHGLFLSVHSPMSVIIGSVKNQVRYMSTETICDQLKILNEIQPNELSRIVVHAASFSGRTPEEVWEVQRKTLWSLYYKMKERGLLNTSLICIENLGKVNQVGDVVDIIRLCNLTENFIPCIDFGHLHGRMLGKFLNSKEEFMGVFAALYAGLPAWKVNSMHIHFSKLVYTDKGEKKHVEFHDKEAGPKPSYFIRALGELPPEFNPVIVCESSNSYVDGYQLKRNYHAHQKALNVPQIPR